MDDPNNTIAAIGVSPQERSQTVIYSETVITITNPENVPTVTYSETVLTVPYTDCHSSDKSEAAHIETVISDILRNITLTYT